MLKTSFVHGETVLDRSIVSKRNPFQMDGVNIRFSEILVPPRYLALASAKPGRPIYPTIGILADFTRFMPAQFSDWQSTALATTGKC